MDLLSKVPGLCSLAHGTSTQALVGNLETIETEVGYHHDLLQPLQYGWENFVKDLADYSGWVPDLPHEHANFVEPFLVDRHRLDSSEGLTTGNEL